jgi:hypothetical protein
VTRVEALKAKWLYMESRRARAWALGAVRASTRIALQSRLVINLKVSIRCTAIKRIIMPFAYSSRRSALDCSTVKSSLSESPDPGSLLSLLILKRYNKE